VLFASPHLPTRRALYLSLPPPLSLCLSRIHTLSCTHSLAFSLSLFLSLSLPLSLSRSLSLSLSACSINRYHKRTAEGQWEKPEAVRREEDNIETLTDYLTRVFENAVIEDARLGWRKANKRVKTRDVPAFDEEQVLDDAAGEMPTKLFWAEMRKLPLQVRRYD
jgi:hypothetical protein